jgi:hypothetical protein
MNKLILLLILFSIVGCPEKTKNNTTRNAVVAAILARPNSTGGNSVASSCTTGATKATETITFNSSGNGILNCSALSASGTNSTRTCTSSDGVSCTTTFGAGVPDWIKNKFNCVNVTTSGNNYVFTTTNLPPWKSAYYSTTSPCYESVMFATTNKANPNTISSQNITLTIPITPTLAAGNTSAFGGGVGISVDGILFFNNEAAPGDSLATEYSTFDDSQGHPPQNGQYHYHVEPPKLTNDGSDFIGLMLDGYLIFGKKNSSGSGTYPTLDSLGTVDCTPTSIGYTTPTKCYHVRNASGVSAFLISNYRGTKGTISQ